MKSLRELAHWISENYPSADKIVEVGVGRVPQVLETLGEESPGCELVATDVQEFPVPRGVDFFLDDVTDPEVDIYRGSDLIFSIRAPPELYGPLRDLVGKVGADLLVKPVSSEESPDWGELVNYSGVAFYVLER